MINLVGMTRTRRELGAAMTHLWTRTATIALMTAALGVTVAGCETSPRYPIERGRAAGAGPQMATPAYPIRRQAETSAAPQRPRVDENGDAVPPAQPTTPVARGSLDPVTSEQLPPASPHGFQRMAFDPQATAAARLFGELATGQGGLILAAHHKAAVDEETPAKGKKPSKKASAKKAEASKNKKACKTRRCRAEEAAAAADERPSRRSGLRGRAEPERATSSKSRRARAEEEPAPIKSSTRAQPGVIAGGAVVSASGPPVNYRVKNGDSVDAIARKLDTTRKQLVEDNDLKKPYHVRPGDVLQGPATRGKAYVVQGGDTLFAIARRFGVEASALADYNDMKVRTGLVPGRKLALPPGFKDHGIPKPPPAPKPAPKPTPRSLPPTPQYPAEPSPPLTQSPYAPAPRPQDTESETIPTQPTAPGPGLSPPNLPPKPPVQPPAPKPAPYTPPPYTPPVQTYRPPVTTPPPMSAPVESAAAVSDTQIASLGAGRFSWPVQGDVISSYGPKSGGQRNDGIDIRAPEGTAVRAAADGVVVVATSQVPSLGNLVVIKHADGWVTVYANLARIDVKMTQKVTQGAQVGQVGSSGMSGEPKLHFEVRYAASSKDKARPYNPALVLP
jgi:murein DD-endopeptidase MepM/ murein hydrolase activator NlpD